MFRRPSVAPRAARSRALVFAALATVACASPLFAQSEERPAPVAASPAPSPRPSTRPSPEASPTAPPTPYGRLAWRSLGPALSGGRVTSVVGSTHDPKLYYLGTAGGGVWKSTDGAATWSPVFDATHVASIGNVALDPQNDNVVWVGTGETNPRNDVIAGAGLYKSVDGAKTWTYVGLRDTRAIAKIAIDPHDSKRMVVGAQGDIFRDSTERGVYVSADGGATWRKSLYVSPRSGVSDLAVDPSNFATMYAGMWAFRREPWTFTSGGDDDGLYKSTNAGATWHRVQGGGFPTGLTGRIGLGVARSDSKRVYALVESKAGILWRSDDAGTTWKPATKNTLVDQRPFYFTHLAIDPKNADHVYGISEMLSESKDGGTTFAEVAKDDVHVDYHAMWIAPDDPDRMIVGEDGGYALSLDAKHWSFSGNLAIGQSYHVGYDDGTPYRVCASLQDNSAFCGPSNALDPNGNGNRHWEDVVGGDGVWTWPDPTDSNYVWSDSQDGSLQLYDRRAQRNYAVQPYFATGTESFDIGTAAHRFNWQSPIAFDPFDPHTVWYGGERVFATHDRGRTWSMMSPDLTANAKAHQHPSGGPLAYDVSGAEYTDTILDIEGSTLHRGEIWVGTDDGRIQLTRDAGTSWHDVTPPNLAAGGRFEIVAPSTLVAGTAYAVLDRHYLGDRAPYAFATTDFGAHWRGIANGLPAVPARSIRPDTRDPHLVYLGLENGLMLSYDDGAHWSAFAPGLPPAPVFDVRIQPRWNDLLLSTHGRGLYAFDDLAPIQGLAAARRAGAMLFAPRPAYAFSQHGDDENTYTNYYAKDPPGGAMVAFYQERPGKTPPAIRIYDAAHRLLRTIAGDHCVDAKLVPIVPNDRSLNRVAWDLREDAPTRWDGAAREAYKGPRAGALVRPGRYDVEVTLGGRSFSQPLDVRADPRAGFTTVDTDAAYRSARAGNDELSRIDTALNRLDAALASAHGRTEPAVATFAARAADARAALTADYHNDEDSIGAPGRVREDVFGLDLQGDGGPPTAAQTDVAARVHAEATAALARVDALFATEGAAADAALKSAGAKPLARRRPPPAPDCTTAA